MKRSEFSATFKPITDEESLGSLIEAKNLSKPPTLYPTRTLTKAPKSKDNFKYILDAKFISDKCRYSGFYQPVQNSRTRRHNDNVNIMMGLRNVYDEVELVGQGNFPAELRRFFQNKRGPGASSLVNSFSSLTNITENNKKRRLDDLVQSISAQAGSTLDFKIVQLENKTPKKDDKPVTEEGEDDDNDVELDEDDDFQYDDDDDDDDDYGTNYNDDDEEGHDAFGNDDGDDF